MPPPRTHHNISFRVPVPVTTEQFGDFNSTSRTDESMRILPDSTLNRAKEESIEMRDLSSSPSLSVIKAASSSLLPSKLTTSTSSSTTSTTSHITTTLPSSTTSTSPQMVPSTPRSPQPIQSKRNGKIRVLKSKKLQGLSQEEAEVKRLRTNRLEKERMDRQCQALKELERLLPEGVKDEKSSMTMINALKASTRYIALLSQCLAKGTSMEGPAFQMGVYGIREALNSRWLDDVIDTNVFKHLFEGKNGAFFPTLKQGIAYDVTKLVNKSFERYSPRLLNTFHKEAVFGRTFNREPMSFHPEVVLSTASHPHRDPHRHQHYLLDHTPVHHRVNNYTAQSPFQGHTLSNAEMSHHSIVTPSDTMYHHTGPPSGTNSHHARSSSETMSCHIGPPSEIMSGHHIINDISPPLGLMEKKSHIIPNWPHEKQSTPKNSIILPIQQNLQLNLPISDTILLGNKGNSLPATDSLNSSILKENLRPYSYNIIANTKTNNSRSPPVSSNTLSHFTPLTISPETTSPLPKLPPPTTPQNPSGEIRMTLLTNSAKPQRIVDNNNVNGQCRTPYSKNTLPTDTYSTTCPGPHNETTSLPMLNTLIFTPPTTWKFKLKVSNDDSGLGSDLDTPTRTPKRTSGHMSIPAMSSEEPDWPDEYMEFESIL